MDLRIYKHILLAAVLLSLLSCRQSKYVADGYYRLSSNEVMFYTLVDSNAKWESDHDKISESEISDLIQPEPNSGIKLFIYNRIDSARFNKQVTRKELKFRKKNEKRQNKVDKKNNKRIHKAKDKGKTRYKQKSKEPKTTRLGWRSWVISHWGEAPVLLDTSKVSKTKQQMKVYLSQRGFKNAVINDSITYIEKKQKAEVTYFIKPGKPYVINSITFDPLARNKNLIKEYGKMLKYEHTDIEVGDLLDEDKLELQREHFTKYLKDNAYFGFSKNYINFVVDTTVGNHKANVVIYIKEKIVPDPRNPDTTVVTNHFYYHVGDVVYQLHNPDSLSFKDWEGYKKRCELLGYSEPYLDDNNKYFLLDTIFVEDTLITKHFLNLNVDFRKSHNIGVFEKYNDTSYHYKGYFIYNEAPFLKPAILDKQNFLEHSDIQHNNRNYAKDYYIDRTFKSFLRLDIFSRITPTVEVRRSDPLGNVVDVQYDLTPAKKQRFVLEPRATNTSSILGVSGVLKYTNKNMFRAGHQLTFSIEGGFQSQPLVTGDRADSSKYKFTGLNTFEIGPELVYKIPRFWPLTKKRQETISKRSFPSTEFSALYNFQIRPEFRRHVSEFSYRWKSSSPDQTQIFTVTPVRFNYVFLNKSFAFDSTLNATNDPFLINSYSDFLSLGILNIKHEYSNQKKAKNKLNAKFKDHLVSNTAQLVAAGLVVNTIYAFTDKNQTFKETFSDSSKLLFNVPFAQFAKAENTFIFNQYINKNHRIAYRLITGLGYAYGNGFALPYAESFVGGGSNDIRAFTARTMAPGSTQTWGDSTATETQIGDLKLQLNLEWRFKIADQWNGALFMDMGNIWKVRSADPSDPGLFKFNDFYRKVAIGVGFGIRYDLTFLILRFDVSWAVHNPYLNSGTKWWLSGGKDYYQEGVLNTQSAYRLGDWPHGPKFNFGIGYPF